MANRHSHKKLRAEIRARMAARGETYQEARHRVLAQGRKPRIAVDLVETGCFGLPMILATFDEDATQRAFLISWALRSVGGWKYPSMLALRVGRGRQ
jgi:hypothetical protein